ncbi:MAG: hypothetical protein H0U78_03995 [Rickettsiaceae bacterium]|nr:hypothetical protein [Rickettsiaceae bacterium]
MSEKEKKLHEKISVEFKEFSIPQGPDMPIYSSQYSTGYYYGEKFITRDGKIVDELLSEKGRELYNKNLSGKTKIFLLPNDQSKFLFVSLTSTPSHLEVLPRQPMDFLESIISIPLGTQDDYPLSTTDNKKNDVNEIIASTPSLQNNTGTRTDSSNIASTSAISPSFVKSSNNPSFKPGVLEELARVMIAMVEAGKIEESGVVELFGDNWHNDLYGS